MAEFKKSWRNAYDKQSWQGNTVVNFPHNVNDPNSSHYLKAETYTRDEMSALFEPIISGIGTTADYYRGDRTWAAFGDEARKYFSATSPLSYIIATGVFSLTRTNLLGTNNQISVSNGTSAVVSSSNVTLSLPQDIATTSSPQFTKLGLGKSATTVLDIISSATSADMGIALSNTNSAGNTWKIWMGTPGNYDTYFKIGLNPANQNDWLGTIYKSTGGVLSMTEAVSAPYHRAPMTGYGDYSLVGWVNTGGNFNGYAFLTADTGNIGSSAADVRLTMGANSASKFSVFTNATELFNITQGGVLTHKGSATIQGNLIQQPLSGSSVTIGDGSYIRASSSLYLDTIADTGGNILIRPKATTIATFNSAGVGVGTSTITEVFNLAGNFKHSGNYSIYNNFQSGWTGTGWRLDYGVTNTNTGTLELDDLWVRGTMSVYELLINQIRATNGSLFVTSSARVKSYSALGGGGIDDPIGRILFEDITGHGVTPFAEDDIIMCQRVSLDAQTVIKRIVRDVITISGLYVYVGETSGGPGDTGNIEPGDDFVRIGNLGTYTNRQGTIYLTADDSNAPYIDILDDVASWADWTDLDKNKGRIGRLSGISSSPFGSLSGYGIYSQNAFMYGNVNVWGTISAGDGYGFEPTFYAGRMAKNMFKKSENALAGDTGYALWIYVSGGATYTNTNSSVIGPGGVSTNVTRIHKSINSGLAAMVVDTANSRCWVGDQGQQDDKTWTISFWVRSTGTDTDGSYTFNLEFPEGNVLGTQVETLVVDEWKRVSFRIDAGSGGNCKVSTTLNYSATDSLEFYGFQFEEGPYATIYQPTDGNSVAPPLTEFGMWARKGGFGGTLANPRVAIKEEGVVVRSASGSIPAWLASDTISIGYSANEWGIIGKSGSTKTFELGSTNQIAGWTFNYQKFYNGDVRLESTSSLKGLAVISNSVDIVKIGDFTYSDLTSSKTDVTVAGIGYSGVNASDGDWEFRGSWWDTHNTQTDPTVDFVTISGNVNVEIYTVDSAHNWDYVVYHSIDDLYLFMGREIRLDYKLRYRADEEYREIGGTHKTYIRYYNGSTITYQVDLFSATVTDGLFSTVYDKTGSTNGHTVKLPYIEGTTDIQICWNFSGGDQSGTDYFPKKLQVELLKLYGYEGYQTYISKNGFEVYNSPFQYIKFAGNRYEINASSLKINNLIPTRFHGRLNVAPTENVQIGDIYVNSNSIGDPVYMCNKMDVYGVPSWKLLS